MNNKTKRYIWGFVGLVICSGALFLTIDDRQYKLDPRTILSPLNKGQLSSWNQFVESTTQTVVSIESTDFDHQLSKYLDAAKHSELVENTTSIMDSNCPVLEINQLSKMVCKQFVILVKKGSFSEAEYLISNHIKIQQKLRDGARQLLTYALAQNNLRKTYGVIDQNLDLLPADSKKLLFQSIEEKQEVRFNTIVEREYSVAMATYPLYQKHRLPGLWMPKNTANYYFIYLQTVLEYLKIKQIPEARLFEEKFSEQLPNIRNYMGTSFISIMRTRPSSCFRIAEDTKNQRKLLLEKMQNQILDPTWTTPVN